MISIILNILKKVDPKWVPSIIGALTVVGSIAYLIYSKRRAEAINEKLKSKLATAEADALDPLIEESKDRASESEKKSKALSKEILELKNELKSINDRSKKSRDKILLATTWEELDL